MSENDRYLFNSKDPQCIDYYISKLSETMDILSVICRRDEDFRTAVMDASFKEVLTVSFCLDAIETKLKLIREWKALRPTKSEALSAAEEHPLIESEVDS